MVAAEGALDLVHLPIPPIVEMLEMMVVQAEVDLTQIADLVVLVVLQNQVKAMLAALVNQQLLEHQTILMAEEVALVKLVLMELQDKEAKAETE